MSETNWTYIQCKIDYILHINIMSDFWDWVKQLTIVLFHLQHSSVLMIFVSK